MEHQRQALIDSLRRNLVTAIEDGKLLKSAGNVALRLPATSGPRAGILHVNAGMLTGKLRDDLERSRQAKLRQVFPQAWLGSNEPELYWSGADLCLEAPWPSALQTRAVLLSEVSNQPHTPGSFTLGPNAHNVTVTPRFDTTTNAHMIVAGMTGSGKTTTDTSIVAQLARNDPRARFVIADGKNDLSQLDGLQGLVGPRAIGNGEIVAALNWVNSERQRREATGDREPLYFLWDEPQEVLLDDKQATHTLFYILSKARSANIHVILSTQSPKQALFGVNMTRGQFGITVCHLVRDRHDSEAAIGDTEPRADHLTAQGDAHILAARLVERVLVALPDQALIDSVMGGKPELAHWPVEYADTDARPGWTPEQVAIGILAARQGWNREQCREALKAIGSGVSNADYTDMRAFGLRVDEIITSLGPSRPSGQKSA